MNTNSFPPYPMPPRQGSSTQSGTAQLTTLSSETGTNNTIRDSTQTYNEISSFIQSVYSSVIPRVQHFESKQEELDRIIQREKILEETVRRLVQISILNCIIIPVGILSIVTLFFWTQYPADCVNFYIEHIFIISFSVLAAFVGFIRPFWLLHGYTKRLDSIEKKLKLNGND